MTAFVLPAGFGKRLRANGTKRSHPEQSLQTHVAGFLSWALEPPVWWTAIGHGGGGKLRGAILKGMGMKAGCPDIMILYRQRAYFIELKAGTSLSDAQKNVHSAIVVAGSTVTVCRSVDDVRDRLEVWGLPTRTEKPSAQRLREAGERLAAEDARERAYREANERWPLPISGSKG